MNKSIKILMITICMLSFNACNAQIKNEKTENIKIFGNCEMCEATIEKAGNLKNVTKVDWNKDTKIATISYDSIKTNANEILKRIALSGYDNEKFLAPDNAYSNLASCCQYNRVAKVPVKEEIIVENNSDHLNQTEIPKVEEREVDQLKAVVNNYFALKEELVKTDGNSSSIKASALLSAINAVKMETLKTDEHAVWMKVLKNIQEDAEHIANTKDVGYQRDHFITLSKNMYELIKVSKQETPTYYQHCPMANNGKGASWLSKESTIKNPYYGAMMLSCGKTVETIK